MCVYIIGALSYDETRPVWELKSTPKELKLREIHFSTFHDPYDFSYLYFFTRIINIRIYLFFRRTTLKLNLPLRLRNWSS